MVVVVAAGEAFVVVVEVSDGEELILRVAAAEHFRRVFDYLYYCCC